MDAWLSADPGSRTRTDSNRWGVSPTVRSGYDFVMKAGHLGASARARVSATEAATDHHWHVQHEDHVALIRDGVAGAGSRWLELGAGDGEFTLALADLLGDAGRIIAVDRDRWALAELERRVSVRFPGTHLRTTIADFTSELGGTDLDGILAANSLHFVPDLAPVLSAIREALVPGGRLVLVEYDATDGNPYVPHPIAFARWQVIAPAAGFTVPRLLHRVPSRFLGSIYAAACERPAR